MASREEIRERLRPFLAPGEVFWEHTDPRYKAQRMRLSRAYKKSLEQEARTAVLEADADATEREWPSDPARALAEWSQETLKVPPGHPLAGNPLTLPPYITDFVRDALTHRESFLCMARKSAKSAGVAVFLLGRLLGPIRLAGYRGGVCSTSREKARELYDQMEAIALASGLAGVTFRRSPLHVLGPEGRVDILSADKKAGHASGFDDVIFDELGLLTENERSLYSGLRGSLGAKGGRFIALSVQGLAPFTAEILARKELPTTAVHHYAAPSDCALDDESAWHAASPALALGIKDLQRLRDEVQIVLVSPSDQNEFRLYELNQPVAPHINAIVTLDEYWRCKVQTLPPKRGRAWIGIDLGRNSSMTAYALYWPETGRLDVRCIWPGNPTLEERGRADLVGDRYQRLADRGELVVLGEDEAVHSRDVVRLIDQDLQGSPVGGVWADSERADELQAAIGSRQWGPGRDRKLRYRHNGATRLHGRDIDAFQQKTKVGGYQTTSEALEQAIGGCKVIYPTQGGAILEKIHGRARIDPLSAAVNAIGKHKFDTEDQEQRHDYRQRPRFVH